jgi:hypothetical protein
MPDLKRIARAAKQRADANEKKRAASRPKVVPDWKKELNRAKQIRQDKTQAKAKVINKQNKATYFDAFRDFEMDAEQVERLRKPTIPIPFAAMLDQARKFNALEVQPFLGDVRETADFGQKVADIYLDHPDFGPQNLGRNLYQLMQGLAEDIPSVWSNTRVMHDKGRDVNERLYRRSKAHRQFAKKAQARKANKEALERAWAHDTHVDSAIGQQGAVNRQKWKDQIR